MSGDWQSFEQETLIGRAGQGQVSSFTRTFVWRCLHWKHPFRDFVCVLRFATRFSVMVAVRVKVRAVASW